MSDNGPLCTDCLLMRDLCECPRCKTCDVLEDYCTCVRTEPRCVECGLRISSFYDGDSVCTCSPCVRSGCEGCDMCEPLDHDDNSDDLTDKEEPQWE